MFGFSVIKKRENLPRRYVPPSIEIQRLRALIVLLRARDIYSWFAVTCTVKNLAFP